MRTCLTACLLVVIGATIVGAQDRVEPRAASTSNGQVVAETRFWSGVGADNADRTLTLLSRAAVPLGEVLVLKNESRVVFLRFILGDGPPPRVERPAPVPPAQPLLSVRIDMSTGSRRE